tara:strand:- start:1922 stop:3775 length:1854 start_codon:yes stop_codon:yes gene_type:complete
LNESGRPELIQNSIGEFLTPSAIFIDGSELIIGKEAASASVMNPSNYAECFKRDVGTTNHLELNGQAVPPEILSAIILRELKSNAEAVLGIVRDVVITVPAFFDEKRRVATKMAGEMCGLNVLGIINEPTAAAVYYGYQTGHFKSSSLKPVNILVYDLGGGTFDVTIVRIQGKSFSIIATDGDVRLGGKDFDERLVNHIAGSFQEEHGLDPRTSAEDCAQLWLDAEQIKKSLSERQSYSTVCFHEGLRSRVEISREMFQNLCSDLLSRTELTTELVLRQADLSWDQIDHLIAVGGSSRMPMVTELLTRISGKNVDRKVSPEHAITFGACIYAGLLSKSDEFETDVAVRDVSSHSLGVVGTDPKTNTKTVAHLIPKNTPLPCTVSRQFSTATPGQSSIVVELVEGESTMPANCNYVGKCSISDLPTGLPARTEIRLNLKYDQNGTLTVEAKIPSARISASSRIERDLNSTPDEFSKWLKVITGQEVVDSPASSELSETDEQRIAIDEIYKQIAALALRNLHVDGVDAILCKSIQANQTEVKLLKTRLLELEQHVPQGNVQRVQLSTKIAQLKQRVSEIKKVSLANIIDLGIDCFKNDAELPGSQELYERCVELIRMSK